MRALARNDSFVMVLIARRVKPGLIAGRSLTTARMCISRVSTCCWQEFWVAAGGATTGSLNSGRPAVVTAPRLRRRGRPPGICLTGHQVTAAVAVDGDTTVPDLQASARLGQSVSPRGRRLVYRVLHGPVLPVWRGMGSRPRRALSRLGGAAVVRGMWKLTAGPPVMVPVMLPSAGLAATRPIRPRRIASRSWLPPPVAGSRRVARRHRRAGPGVSLSAASTLRELKVFTMSPSRYPGAARSGPAAGIAPPRAPGAP